MRELHAKPRLLVVGGATVGAGFEELASANDIELVETDVALGDRTQIVADAHDLPFYDSTFHGVVAQAVLEHVIDPERCVSELHRVLVPGGLIYVEAPFMQQVHEGAHDFTRFTHSGLRRLLRRFEEIDTGPVSGAGTVLAWSLRYFMEPFASRPLTRKLIVGGCRLAFSWLKYVDRYFMTTPDVYDSASGYFFLGRRLERPRTAREIVSAYRGAQKHE